MNKIAIMQPYLFPYLGYFQLINSSDLFVSFDNANFIKRGWINRNRMIVNRQEYLFTLPLQNTSQNRLINEHEIYNPQHNVNKLFNLIRENYKKSKFFSQLDSILYKISIATNHDIASFNLNSLMHICDFLNIKTEFKESSKIDIPPNLQGQRRIISIVHALGGATYVNLPGGKALYNESEFNLEGIDLEFIEPKLFSYNQNLNIFLPGLSIIDVIANVDQETLINHFKRQK